MRTTNASSARARLARTWRLVLPIFSCNFFFLFVYYYFFLNSSWHTHTGSPIVKADTTARRYSVVGAENWTRRRIKKKKKTYWQPISGQLTGRPMTCRITNVAAGSFPDSPEFNNSGFSGRVSCEPSRNEPSETSDWFVRPTQRRRRVLDFILEGARTSRKQTRKPIRLPVLLSNTTHKFDFILQTNKYPMCTCTMYSVYVRNPEPDVWADIFQLTFNTRGFSNS